MSLPTLHRATAGIVLGLYVLSAAGCTTWHNQQGDVATIVAPAPKASPDASPASAGVPGLAQDRPVHPPKAEGPGELRVTTATRGTIELRNPRVANDSLYGLVGKSGTEVGFSVADVTSVQTRQGSTGKTVALMVGIAVPVGLIVGGMIALSQMACIGFC
jgi:hypothetical protein